MKNAKKVLLLALCALLLVGASIAGTVAYLTSNKTVTNTFTIGKVEITLIEAKLNPQTGAKLTGNEAEDVTAMQDIELVPGRKIDKNPKITVSGESEECYLFVKIENGLLGAGTINNLTGWVSINGDANADAVSYYRYNVTANASDVIPVFESFTCSSAITEYDAAMAGKQIIVTAYAIQAEGLSADQAAATLNLPTA